MTICLFVMPTIRQQTSHEICYKIFSGFVTPKPRFVQMANFVIAVKNWNFYQLNVLQQTILTSKQYVCPALAHCRMQS